MHCRYAAVYCAYHGYSLEMSEHYAVPFSGVHPGPSDDRTARSSVSPCCALTQAPFWATTVGFKAHIIKSCYCIPRYLLLACFGALSQTGNDVGTHIGTQRRLRIALEHPTGLPDSFDSLEGRPTHDDAAEPRLTRRYPHINASRCVHAHSLSSVLRGKVHLCVDCSCRVPL